MENRIKRIVKRNQKKLPQSITRRKRKTTIRKRKAPIRKRTRKVRQKLVSKHVAKLQHHRVARF